MKKPLDILAEGKIGAYWLLIAMERIAAGENEKEVMLDYGYKMEERRKPISTWVGANRRKPLKCIITRIGITQKSMMVALKKRNKLKPPERVGHRRINNDTNDRFDFSPNRKPCRR